MNEHRVSGYKRVERDAYQTIEPWVTHALCRSYSLPAWIWEPAAGDMHMVNALKARGHAVFATDIAIADNQDFLLIREPPFPKCRIAIVTNPPFGKRGITAEHFAWQGLELTKANKGIVALLLPSDFDHGVKRNHLFRHTAYAMRLNLLARPRWFDGEATPKANFCWHVWDWRNCHAPIVRYAGRDDE